MTTKEVKKRFDQTYEPLFLRFTQKNEDIGVTDQDIDTGWIVKIDHINIEDVYEFGTSYTIHFEITPELYDYCKKISPAVYENDYGTPNSLDFFEVFHPNWDGTKPIRHKVYYMEDDEGFLELLTQNEVDDIVKIRKDDKFISFLEKEYPMFMNVFWKDYRKHLDV